MSEPAAPGSDTPRPGQPAASAWRGSGNVLVVDDEAPIRILVAHTTERLGFTPTMVSDGLQAVAAVQADPGSWTVVILDLKLPGIDGIEVLRRIRVLRPDIPVILMSGYYRNMPPSGPDTAAPTGFLNKPFTLEMLVQQLRATLKL